MNKQLKEGIIIGVIVLLVIIFVYFLSGVFITNEYGNKSGTTTTTKKDFNNQIMAGNTFNQTDSKYMVIFLSNDSSDELKDAVNSYSGDTKLYTVNLSYAVNNYVRAKKDNKTPSDSSDLKIKDIALITIDNNVVTSYITNEDVIIDEIK